MSEPPQLSTGKMDRVGRYRHWRKVGKALVNRMMSSLSNDDLDAGGHALDVIEGKTLVFDTEDQTAAFMDFCLHYVYRDGKNVARRTLEEGALSDDERTYLEAVGRGRYSVFSVVRAEPGVGLEMVDICREDRLFVVDLNFSMTARPGAAFASRMTPMEDFWMTGGAGLPVSGEASAALKSRIPEWAAENAVDWQNLTGEKEASFAELVVRTCLHESQSAGMMYAEPEEAGGVGNAGDFENSGGVPLSRGEKIGRNEPCPCGSGKKYKKCCGRGV